LRWLSMAFENTENFTMILRCRVFRISCGNQSWAMMSSDTMSEYLFNYILFPP
jgi:hypothetical protein